MKFIKVIPFIFLLISSIVQAQEKPTINMVHFEMSRNYMDETQLRDEVIHQQIQEGLKQAALALNGLNNLPLPHFPFPYIATVENNGLQITATSEIFGPNGEIQKLRVELNYDIYVGFIKADIRLFATQIYVGF